jgi:hypothetical protein
LKRRLQGARPLYVEESGRVWLSRGLQIFRRDADKDEETLFGNWPPAWRDRLGGASRLAARALRSGLKGLLPLPDGSVLALAHGRLLRAGHGHVFKEVLRLGRGSGPLGICVTPDGALYFGEYFFNEARDDVRILFSRDCGETWASVYTFPRGKIRHIHNIVYDPFRKGCWVTTGDDDSESMILFTADKFRTLEPVFRGEQRFRAVSLIPSADALITATDTPYQQNHIMRLFPETGRIEEVQAVPGSVFALSRVGRFSVASVAVEPSRINLSQDAILLVSEEGAQWKELYRQKRDRWQLPYTPLLPDKITELPFFQHGAFALPWGAAKVPILYAYGQALREDDDCLLAWDLQEAAGGLFQSKVTA